jgi:hypothetical protein
MPMTKDALISQINERSAAIRAAERDAARELKRLKAQRARLLLEANRAGATYDELVARCRVSDGYVAKAIRQARKRAPRRLAAHPRRQAVSAA